MQCPHATTLGLSYPMSQLRFHPDQGHPDLSPLPYRCLSVRTPDGFGQQPAPDSGVKEKRHLIENFRAEAALVWHLKRYVLKWRRVDKRPSLGPACQARVLGAPKAGH